MAVVALSPRLLTSKGNSLGIFSLLPSLVLIAFAGWLKGPSAGAEAAANYAPYTGGRAFAARCLPFGRSSSFRWLHSQFVSSLPSTRPRRTQPPPGVELRRYSRGPSRLPGKPQRKRGRVLRRSGLHPPSGRSLAELADH